MPVFNDSLHILNTVFTVPMEETYTSFESAMIQMIYGELEAADVIEMGEWMDEDPALRLMLDELRLTKSELPKVQFNPSQGTLQSILQYSTKTANNAWN